MAAIEVRASRFWGSGLAAPTKLFLPDLIRIDDDSVTVIKRAWFGLTGTDERIPFERIASIRLRKGVFTGAVTIETPGGSAPSLTVAALPKQSAIRVAELIRNRIQAVKQT